MAMIVVAFFPKEIPNTKFHIPSYSLIMEMITSFYLGSFIILKYWLIINGVCVVSSDCSDLPSSVSFIIDNKATTAILFMHRRETRIPKVCHDIIKESDITTQTHPTESQNRIPNEWGEHQEKCKPRRAE